ncbi:MAG: sterol desaturase family protein [Bacteroidia bacterium]|jgi:beta-carotene 3-hydroxylase
MIEFAITVFTFILMEGVAWFAHKYIMHGFLWSLHRDHHQPGEGFFERNDFFFLIFAIPAVMCFIAGMNNLYFFAVGLGIALYGLGYFTVHDIIIHQRFRMLRRWNNRYVTGIRRAHKMHHKHLGKHEGENFGMLLVPMKYFKLNKTLE